MTKNIEICKAEEVGAQVLDIRTTAERQTVAAINAAFGLAIPLPANEPGEITELPAAVSAHDRQLLAQTLGKPEPAATLSTTDPLATFVATLTRELYRHLVPRTADYLPADFPDLFARNLAHLLQAVQSLSPRKISNGGATSDGLPDGMSLAHLLCGSDAYNAVLEIKDDNPSWTWSRSLPTFPNLKRLTILCNGTMPQYAIANLAELESIDAPNITATTAANSSGDGATMYAAFSNLAKLKTLNIPSVASLTCGGNGNQYNAMIAGCPLLEEVTLGRVANNNYAGWGGTKWVIQYCQAIEKISVESLVENNCLVRSGQNENLIYLQIRGIQANNCNLSWWNPTDKGTTFLQNFKEHIALRLTDNGSGKTLTLSQAVYTAVIEGSSEICTQIKSIISDKHWKVTDGTNIYPQ